MGMVFDYSNERHYLSACKQNERWAQELLYKEYYSSMMAVCIRYAGDKAEAMDILHEGFIKVFAHIHRYQEGTSLTAWMKRIMVNTAIDFYRKQVRRRTEDIEVVSELSALEPDVLNQLSTNDILSCLQELTPIYRQIFNLYVLEGLPHKEIAEKMGISESTSRSNLVKARTKLRALIEKKGERYGSK